MKDISKTKVCNEVDASARFEVLTEKLNRIILEILNKCDTVYSVLPPTPLQQKSMVSIWFQFAKMISVIFSVRKSNLTNAAISLQTFASKDLLRSKILSISSPMNGALLIICVIIDGAAE